MDHINRYHSHGGIYDSYAGAESSEHWFSNNVIDFFNPEHQTFELSGSSIIDFVNVKISLRLFIHAALWVFNHAVNARIAINATSKTTIAAITNGATIRFTMMKYYLNGS